MKFIIMLCAAVALAACERPILSDDYITGRDWAKPTLVEQPRQLYCYRTLASVDCHAEPLRQPEAGERLVSSYGVPTPPVPR